MDMERRGACLKFEGRGFRWLIFVRVYTINCGKTAASGDVDFACVCTLDNKSVVNNSPVPNCFRLTHNGGEVWWCLQDFVVCVLLSKTRTRH